MLEAATRTTFSSLPTELRLHIAAYALEQEPFAGFIHQELPKLCPDLRYKSSFNLSIRLVCRQFWDDFTRLAYQKTRFVLSYKTAQIIGDQPDERLKNVRRLVIDCDHRTSLVTLWQQYPFNRACLQLDELCIMHIQFCDIALLARVFRQLRNVKLIRFIKHRWFECYRLMGAILREDHHQRYDAPDAPNLGSTWWDWMCNEQEDSFTLVAREPMPLMEEQEYMLFVKPKVDEVMDNVARLMT
jgi:hypothetical protein